MTINRSAILKVDIKNIDQTLDFLDDFECEFDEEVRQLVPRIKEELLYCKQDRLAEINLLTRKVPENIYD